MRLILASRSPRRRGFLAALGLEFEVVEPAIEEVTAGEPEGVVLANARRKAQVAARQAPAGSLVLAGDTEVVIDERVLGKARSRDKARAHLRQLSGRSHIVLGGLVVLGPLATGDGGAERSAVARSAVTFRPLEERLVARYLDSGEWRDRAGAYAIQGLGSMLVTGVEGDLSNVIGLPVRLLMELAPELFPGGLVQ